MHRSFARAFGPSPRAIPRAVCYLAFLLLPGGQEALGVRIRAPRPIVFGDLRKLPKNPVLSFAPLTRYLQSRRPPMNWSRGEAPEDLRHGGAGSERADRFVLGLSTAASLLNIAFRFPC